VVLVVVLVWGACFVLIKVGLREAPPIFFAALQYVLGSLPLLAWGLLTEEIGQTRWSAAFLGNVLFLGLAVIVYSGAHFYTGAWQALRHRSANMRTLIALGTGVAWIYSTIVLLFSRIFPPLEFLDVYYDVTVVVIALADLGLAMELRAKGRTSEAIKKLIGLGAKTARVVRDGREVDIPRGRDGCSRVRPQGARRVRVRVPDGDVSRQDRRGVAGRAAFIVARPGGTANAGRDGGR